MKAFKVIDNYKGIDITICEASKYHVAETYEDYNSVHEVKKQIDKIIKEREDREPLLEGKYKQVFDKRRGACLEIDGELYTIQTISEKKAGEHEYLRNQEYIYVNNSRGSSFEPVGLFRKSFSHRPKDAVEAIRAGEGDFIEMTNLFGNRSEHVIRLLNREIGERARAETIKGFEDAEFIIALRMNIDRGWGQAYDIGENDSLINGMWSDWKLPRAFETEQAAYDYSQELRKRIKETVAELTDEEKLEAWYREMREQETAVSEGAILEYQRLHSEEKHKELFNFEIVQVLIP